MRDEQLSRARDGLNAPIARYSPILSVMRLMGFVALDPSCRCCG
jgi:hypothetical protein